ncbi:MAG: DUF3108 domain-containing protein [Thermodesulfobacteria bacterium]|nr:DUF3108 domain-containing protein [Thermodesulfobacteriota bacterium]
MRNFLVSFLLSFLLLVWLVAPASGSEKSTLRYKVTWLGIPAGKIKFVVEKEGSLIKLYAKSKTIGMARLVYPFKSEWTTWIDEDGYPVKSRIWFKKRGKEVLKEYIFDQKKGEVIRLQKGHRKVYKLSHFPVYDELSAFYATMKLVLKKPGEEHLFWVFAHKKANQALLRYLKDETIRTSCGPLEAQKLQVEFGFESELIKRSKEAYLWKIRDLIVKSQGDLAIGHVTGTLTNLDCKEVKP